MRVNCSGEGCTKFTDVSEAVAKNTQYICADHTPKITDGPKFQDYAFDHDLAKSNMHLGKLRSALDEAGFSSRSGFQVKNFRTGYKKETPEWARMKEGIQKILLTAFPKLNMSPSQRRRAGRWAQVINLYYLKGWSVSEVAEELNEDPRVIKRLTMSISRVSKGFTVDGKQRNL